VVDLGVVVSTLVAPLRAIQATRYLDVGAAKHGAGNFGSLQRSWQTAGGISTRGMLKH